MSYSSSSLSGFSQSGSEPEPQEPTGILQNETCQIFALHMQLMVPDLLKFYLSAIAWGVVSVVPTPPSAVRPVNLNIPLWKNKQSFLKTALYNLFWTICVKTWPRAEEKSEATRARKTTADFMFFGENFSWLVILLSSGLFWYWVRV